MAVIKTTKIGQGEQRNSATIGILAHVIHFMRLLYNFLTYLSIPFLWLAGLFNPKMRQFMAGRRGVLDKLSKQLDTQKNTIWFHCASLGEFEQGVPIMEAIKKEFPAYQLVITFFSPSGYTIKKDTPLADVVVYLPLDTKANAKKFIQLVKPAIAIFVKYEFWPNYLFELERNQIPALLVSGLFRKDQAFFKWHGSLLREALGTMEHYFVQDQHSARLLGELGQKNITVSGDTRFDRVSHQIEQDNQLDFADAFIHGKLCLVGGSTWPEDMEVLLPFLNKTEGLKTLLAPHTMDADKLDKLEQSLDKKVLRYSQLEGKDLSQFDVLIVDTIGLLSRLYSYADLAYVGGGMGTSGLHNILEAATFGIPIVIGKNYQKFPEAVKLEDIAGLYSIKDAAECSEIMTKLVTDKNFREKTGMICGHYVNSNTGATETIMAYIRQLHTDSLI